MREAAFIKQNHEKWEEFEVILSQKDPDPDKLAELFIQITDDLAFSQTQYPKSKTTYYLNGLASKVHQNVYKTKKERKNRTFEFWKYELPMIVKSCHKYLFYSFIIFTISMGIGAISSANDDTFIRLILGDDYVNMTLENIDQEDPMAVYKSMDQTDMFLRITLNNIYVSFMAFVMGILIPVGTPYVLFKNGVMLGSFQYFFFEQGLFLDSFLTIWIHGTLEISAIVIAGAAGLVIANSIMFPGTYTRLDSFRSGAKKGLKIVIGLIPIFIMAGFLESFVTRYTDLPIFIKALIILISAFFIIYYFVIYPNIVARGSTKN